MIGYMAMPADFKYKDVFLKGQPVHQWNDSFRLKHPSMDPGHRAKICAPFDALAGFDDAVAAKEVLYEFKRELSNEEKEELNRRLSILHRLTWNGRITRENAVRVKITYYIPCNDKENFSYGYRGQYVTATGICKKITTQTIQIDTLTIPLADVYRIEGENIFDMWEDYAS